MLLDTCNGIVALAGRVVAQGASRTVGGVGAENGSALITALP